jgi:tetratricopeptide (TPR) repeat protein
LYKSKKTEAAEKVYDNAAQNAKEPAGKSRAVYNKGVALTRQSKLQESIDAYKDALRLIPTDEEARQNLQKALNELKKQQQQQPKDDKKKQDKDKQKQKPNDQPQNKSKLNEKQAERMLNSLRQEEKKLQQGMQKKNNTGGANSKDW